MPRVGRNELWPQVVDRLAREQPEAIYGLWPVAADTYHSGFFAINYGQLANIVNGLAWWIVHQLGPGTAQDGDVLTYIGRNDVRLTAMILASVKAGYTVSRQARCPITAYSKAGDVDVRWHNSSCFPHRPVTAQLRSAPCSKL